MLTERQVARLARRAARGLTWGARRRARAELRTAAVAGDLGAVRALADLGDPTGDSWWRQVPPRPGEVSPGVARALTCIVLQPAPDLLTDEMRPALGTAVLLEHPVAEIAQAKILAHPGSPAVDDVCWLAERHDVLADFCREHGVAPTDPVKQARYLLTTEQLDRYRALDHDGSLLLTAYRGATSGEKDIIRQRAVAQGAPDLAHLLLRGDWREPGGNPPSGEIGMVADAFASRADWPALWELVTEIPLLDAVRLAEPFAADWAPANPADRRLYDALRRTSTADLRRAVDRPSLVRAIRPPGAVRAAAAGAQLAVAWSERAEPGTTTYLDLYDPATGDLLARHDHGTTAKIGAELAANGEATLVGDRMHGLVRYTTEQREVLSTERVVRLAAAGGTYAACTADSLLIGTADEPSVRHLPFADLGLHGENTTVRALTVAPDGSRIGLATDELFVRLTATGRVLTHRSSIADVRPSWATRVSSIAFLDQNTLVTLSQTNHRDYRTHQAHVDRWRVTGDTLTKTASSTAEWHASPSPPGSVTPLPARNQVLVQRLPHRMEVLDADTLENTADEELLVQRGHDCRPHGPAGEHGFVVQFPSLDWLEVHDLSRAAAVRLLDQPVAALTARHLQLLSALDPAAIDPGVELLRAYLERRFGTDVQLGGRRAPGSTDISLGGRSC